MYSRKYRAAAVGAAFVMLYGSLLTTAAFAAPPKSKKKPPAKKPAATDLVVAGKKVYDANGCKNCHVINGVGGKVGPDLTKVGADTSHTAKWLADHVRNPKSHTPESSMPAFGADRIKDKDLLALGAYLASLKK